MDSHILMELQGRVDGLQKMSAFTLGVSVVALVTGATACAGVLALWLF